MSEAQSSRGFGARFSRAVGSLVLALLNATLLLFIVAAIAGLLLLDKVRTLSADVATQVTEAAIHSTGVQPADALAELRVVSTEIRDLRAAVTERRTDVDDKVAALSARLDELDAKIDLMRERRIEFTDALIDKATTAIGNAAKSVRDCKPEPMS